MSCLPVDLKPKQASGGTWTGNVVILETGHGYHLKCIDLYVRFKANPLNNRNWYIVDPQDPYTLISNSDLFGILGGRDAAIAVLGDYRSDEERQRVWDDREEQYNEPQGHPRGRAGSPAPVEDYAGPYRNDGGEAVADWASTMTRRLRDLLRQDFDPDPNEFLERRNDVLVRGQPGEALNIWLRDPSRPPSAVERSQVRRALSGWLTMAAELLGAWTRARRRGRFDQPRRVREEWLSAMRSSSDNDDIPNFIGQQRVVDVFAGYIEWLNATFETNRHP